MPPGESLHGLICIHQRRLFFGHRIPLRGTVPEVSRILYRPDRVCVVYEDFARRYCPKGSRCQRVFQGTDSDDARLFTVWSSSARVKQAELTETAGQGAVYCLTVSATEATSSSSLARVTARRFLPTR